MKRKVIQIAGSTQLVSLPRQWAKAHNVQRGQEIDVQEDGNRIIMTADFKPVAETATLDISKMGDMVHRAIGAIYRKGVDELTIKYDDPSLIEAVHSAIGKETVGFEILEQGSNYCTVKYVGGNVEEFSAMLRRTFLIATSMAQESVAALKNKQYKLLNNLAFLEETNNRFTSLCRRFLNKTGAPKEYSKIGPLYYIVEQLEKIGDQYKYICQHFSNLEGKNIVLNADVLETFEKANSMVSFYYALFYKFDTDVLVELKKRRNYVVEKAHKLFEKKLTYADYWLVHHSLMITEHVFSMSGAALILNISTGVTPATE